MNHTVKFDRSMNSLEMRSESNAPNLTVYRPRRDHFNDKEFKVTPGYVNSSSFRLNDARDMLDFKVTMSSAISELNEYNSVVPDWVEIEDPWREVESLRREINYLKSEAGAKQTLANIKAAKKS